MTEELHSLFTRDGSLLVPTAAALGPWRPDALHGGAVSALLGNSLEEDGWQLARVTMDLLRRVPLEPLRLTAEARAGTRTILRKEAALWAGDVLVAKAAALLLPETEVDLRPNSIGDWSSPPSQKDRTQVNCAPPSHTGSDIRALSVMPLPPATRDEMERTGVASTG
jgi:hypothetical protein